MDLGNYGKNKPVTFGQVLNRFLLKTLQIILGSRIPSTLPHGWNGEVKNSDKWYNLVLGHRFATMDDLCSWTRTLTEPMVIDIILVRKSKSFSIDMFKDVILERWIICFESQKSMMTCEICGVSCKKTYKKLIILLRSVYSILRLLPAYQAFRKLSSLQKNCGFDIKYNVCSVSGAFSEPQESMKGYSFVPVEAAQGRFGISVCYREDLSDFNMDGFVLHPLEIISDYVDSPSPSSNSNKSSSTIRKVSRDAKQDSGFPNFLYSLRFPYFGSSRISTKSSLIVDSFGDSDFSCPFIVDDTDPLDGQASLKLDGTNSAEVSLKSQDAAVGAVIRLLRNAPPLQQDPHCYNKLEKEDGAASESKLCKPRKTSDGLEELKLYRNMKDVLLAKNAALRCIGKI
ncbi:hypothetical protein CDL12_24701 [Handroanthus impetiginosus]|uniref:Autophagy-related protein 13 N-terminal domain-containing protein n=1 Tax=Handroanthus impetiginosus TaxID=429701 RepID=A0A2G9GBW4_9LAMI|nr:hypothetical protein CDL12_24701 [Handroanthus impetiginosus]